APPALFTAPSWDARSGTPRIMSSAPFQTSLAVSRFCAVPSVSLDSPTNIFHRISTCASVDLPACRATRSNTVRNRYVPSSRSSRAPFRNSCCHGSNVTPTTSCANSMHSNPRLVSGVSSRSGGVYRRGRGLPLGGIVPAAAPHIRQLAACLFLVERRVHTRPRGQEQGVQHRLPVWPRVGNLPSRIRRRLIRHLFDLLCHHPGCCNRRTVRRLEVRCLGNGAVEFLD